MNKMIYVDDMSSDGHFGLTNSKEKIQYNARVLEVEGIIAESLPTMKSGVMVLPVIAGVYIAIFSIHQNIGLHRMYIYKPEFGEDFRDTNIYYLKGSLSNETVRAVNKLGMRIFAEGTDSISVVAGSISYN